MRTRSNVTIELPCLLAVLLVGCADGTTEPPGSVPKSDGGSALMEPPADASYDTQPAPGTTAAEPDARSRDADIDTASDPGADPSCAPTAEICNGGDDDCDGLIDEAVTTCPCVTVVLADSTYLFCEPARSWAGAQRHCQLHGYELAMIDDATEDALLYATLSGLSLGDTWIGSNDLLVESGWVWRDGSPMLYSNWDMGEPNDGGEGGEDCGVLMTREGRESFWDDRSCDDERSYVCEASLLAL